MKRTIGCLLTFLLLLLLVACDDGRRERMEALLDRADSLNRAYIPMTGGLDTMLLEATKYYDRHGTANEQLRAHYLLGCAYRDMGEAPAALSAYHDAVERVDTTDADCNFALLARVHGQMAALFEDYAMPRNQLDEERAAYRYAMMGKDTVAALAFFNKQASCYSRLGVDDSVIYLCEEASRHYMEIGDTLKANTALGPAIASYLDKKNYIKAKDYLDKLEYHSTLTGKESFIEKQHYLLYYKKGEYYAAMNQYDSAVTAYNKIVKFGESPNNITLGYYGLYSLYRQMGKTDSIVKYADFYTQSNAEFVGRLEQSKLQAAQSLYNYARHQRTAERESAKSEHFKTTLSVVCALTVILALLFIIAYVRHRDEKRHLEDRIQLLRGYAVNEHLYNSPIAQRFRELLKANPYQNPDLKDWKELTSLIDREVPSFRVKLQMGERLLSDVEYDVCMLIKIQISSSDIARLKHYTPSNVTHIRERIFKTLFRKKGKADELDEYIMSLT